MNKIKERTWPFISSIAFILTLIVNYGSAFGWFGATQKEISNLYRNFMTPEPFTFSIWGVIYLLVIVFLIQQFRRPNYEKKVMDRLHLYFILTCIFNILWNITWNRDLIAISTVFIFAFTIVLGLLNQWILKHHHFFKSHIIEPITFSIYFGWLTVATVTNVSALLVKNNWSMWGLSEHIWTCLIYLAIALLAGYIIHRTLNPLFNIPIIWAFVGVIAMLINNPPKTPIHSGMPWVAAGVMIVLLVESVKIYRHNNQHLLPQ